MPHAIQGLEPRCAELPSGRHEVEIAVARRTDHLAATRSEVPVELVDLARGQRHHEGVAVPMERRGLAESPRQEDANGPFIDRLEEVRMPQQKHPELGGPFAGGEVEEHVAPLAFERHADRGLVGKEPRGFLRRR
ncbi:MAG: hypothetical protein DMF94_25510 [Acidobacteria bacterium]|nr:MAG: hypothetical protein DMF94_25510 [Acidobacteriota bacterium]